jgi:SAM-dependent methyltransferase
MTEKFFPQEKNFSVMSKYGGVLASFYDADHFWRDYRKQSRFFDSLFPQAAARENLKVLDLCCGSGSHALPLGKKGFRVTGVDDSGEILSRARRKLKGTNLSVAFRKRDIFSADFSREFELRFDGAFLLGWTLSIQPIFDRFPEILKAVFQVLKPGGIFAFDVPMGTHFNPVSARPLRYEVSPRLNGTLRIKEKKDLEKGSCTYLYDWEIKRKMSQGGKIFKMRLRAEEALSILEPRDVFDRIRNFGNGFEIFARCRDYRLDRPFRGADKNLVVVLRKNVFRH